MAKKKEREKKNVSGVKFQMPQPRVDSIAVALFCDYRGAWSNRGNTPG